MCVVKKNLCAQGSTKQQKHSTVAYSVVDLCEAHHECQLVESLEMLCCETSEYSGVRVYCLVTV